MSDPLQTSSNVSTKFRGLSVVIDFTPEDDVVTLTNTFDTIVREDLFFHSLILPLLLEPYNSRYR